MREHKYRGKQKDNGEWTYGYLFQIWDQAYILWGTTNGIPNMIEVDPATVGLCTGKKDIAKKDIYAGDVVRAQIYRDEQAMILEVKWLDGAFVFDYPGDGFDYQNIGNFPGVLEVVGNLTENPELLEAKP